MHTIWLYIRENKNVIYIALGQTFLVLVSLSVLYYIINYVTNLPGFQFDPFLIILVAIIGWQFWRISEKQNLIIERQNNLIEQLNYNFKQYPALTGKVVSKAKTKKK